VLELLPMGPIPPDGVFLLTYAPLIRFPELISLLFYTCSSFLNGRPVGIFLLVFSLSFGYFVIAEKSDPPQIRRPQNFPPFCGFFPPGTGMAGVLYISSLFSFSLILFFFYFSSASFQKNSFTPRPNFSPDCLPLRFFYHRLPPQVGIWRLLSSYRLFPRWQ